MRLHPTEGYASLCLPIIFERAEIKPGSCNVHYPGIATPPCVNIEAAQGGRSGVNRGIYKNPDVFVISGITILFTTCFC